MKPPYQVSFWAPFNVALVDATHSITLKAPEIGNTDKKARNQLQQRTRSGVTTIIDRGRDYNTEKKFQFRNITTLDMSSLNVFLAAIQWGSTIIKYRDYNGVEYSGRMQSTSLQFIDRGYITKTNPTTDNLLWDFDLDFLDLTDNTSALLENVEVPVGSPLSLHLADFNSPHNPRVRINLSSGDGAKIIEQFFVDDWNAICWIISCWNTNNAKKAFFFVSVTHDGTPTSDATAVNTTVEVLNDPDGLYSDLTILTQVTGAGLTQVIQLVMSSTTNGNKIDARRIKL